MTIIIGLHYLQAVPGCYAGRILNRKNNYTVSAAREQ